MRKSRIATSPRFCRRTFVLPGSDEKDQGTVQLPLAERALPNAMRSGDAPVFRLAQCFWVPSTLMAGHQPHITEADDRSMILDTLTWSWMH